jgi:hypothetical protein
MEAELEARRSEAPLKPIHYLELNRNKKKIKK